MGVRTYVVPGMTCDNCRQAIENEVIRVPGVASVAIDLDAKTVRVEGTAGEDLVRQAVEEAGYEVETVG